jgi:hypothetical protein
MLTRLLQQQRFKDLAMQPVYFDKTEKGRQEILHRTYHLNAKLRPLLVIVDGKHTAEDLLKKVQGLGLTEVHFHTLLSDGFISARDLRAKVELNNVEAINPVTSQTGDAFNHSHLPRDSAEQRMAVKTFFDESIKNSLGLRGFGLQLKVERAESLDDFIELRESFLEAVEKSKGKALADSLAVRLNQLLDQSE